MRRLALAAVLVGNALPIAAAFLYQTGDLTVGALAALLLAGLAIFGAGTWGLCRAARKS